MINTISLTHLDPSDPGRSPCRLTRLSGSCLAVRGELDLASASRLRAALADERVEIVDMAGVTFTDVAGLSPLLAVMAVGDRRLRLRRPSRCVRRLLDLVGMAVDGDVRVTSDRTVRRVVPPGADRDDGRRSGAVARAPGDAVRHWAPKAPASVAQRRSVSGPVGAGFDDRPLDQFVDEILDRVTALQALIDAHVVTVDAAAVRRVGRELLAGLWSTEGQHSAAQLADALWSTTRGGRVPARWLETPLGALIERAAGPLHTDAAPVSSPRSSDDQRTQIGLGAAMSAEA